MQSKTMRWHNETVWFWYKAGIQIHGIKLRAQNEQRAKPQKGEGEEINLYIYAHFVSDKLPRQLHGVRVAFAINGAGTTGDARAVR